MNKIRMVLILLFVNTYYPVYGQFLKFEREINPFDLKKKTGLSYKMPFLGGFNAPSYQFLDIDSDNDLDLFIQEVDNQIIYFENKGSTNSYDFYWITDNWLNQDHGAWFYFVDIDNDNDFDLFSQGQNEMIRYWVNQENVYSVLTDTLFSQDGNPVYSELSSKPHFFDIDCNGTKDLFMGRQTGRITYYNNVNSAINQSPLFAFVTDSYQDIEIIGTGFKKDAMLHGANSLTFGDLNGDGQAELLYGDFFSRSLYYFENNGTCQEAYLTMKSDSFPESNPLKTSGFNFPGLADIDSDGDLDLFATVLGGAFSIPQNRARNFYFYQNLGTAQDAEFFLVTENFLDQFDAGEQSVPTFVDIDDDGDQDLFIGNLTEPELNSSRGQLLYFENTGDASNPKFQLVNDNYIVVENMYNYAPTFADIDNDKDYDLLLGREFGRLVFFRNDGNSHEADFNLITANFMGIDVGSVSTPAFIDIDKDNDYDLLIGEFDGNINLYENIGDADSAQFILKTENFAGIYSGGYSKPSLFDFDNDGDFDLILGNEDGGIVFYRNDSSADSVVFTELPGYEQKVSAVSTPVMADIDNDGDGDVICGTLGGGLVYFENVNISAIKNIEHPNPAAFELFQNFPNPYNATTVIKYYLNKNSIVLLNIYDINGKKIKTLINRKQPAGVHSVEYKEPNLASGLYFYSLETEEAVLRRKMILIK